jgi:hypothetical protein
MIIKDVRFGPIAQSVRAEEKKKDLPAYADKSKEGWWAQQDSNLRPKDYESSALTD